MNEPVAQKSFSQFGEDLLVLKHFGDKKDGFFIEVGANDPENLSQTLLLERHGWQGILVEPQPAYCERIRRVRNAKLFQVACGAPEQRGKARFELKEDLSRLVTGSAPISGNSMEVDVVTLDDILKQAGNPTIDFVSIDVEGFELQVLSGFNLGKHRPGIIMLEDNFPNRLAVHAYMKQHGYRLVKRTGCNNWYVPRDEPFALSTPWEKIKLFRKMFLGTAFRRLKNRLKGRSETT